MPDPDWNAIAEAASQAYALIVRAAAQPLPVPEWEELPPRHQEAWREVGRTVCELCGSAAAT